MLRLRRQYDDEGRDKADQRPDNWNHLRQPRDERQAKRKFDSHQPQSNVRPDEDDECQEELGSDIRADYAVRDAHTFPDIRLEILWKPCVEPSEGAVAVLQSIKYKKGNRDEPKECGESRKHDVEAALRNRFDNFADFVPGILQGVVDANSQIGRHFVVVPLTPRVESVLRGRRQVGHITDELVDLVDEFGDEQESRHDGGSRNDAIDDDHGDSPSGLWPSGVPGLDHREAFDQGRDEIGDHRSEQEGEQRPAHYVHDPRDGRDRAQHEEHSDPARRDRHSRADFACRPWSRTVVKPLNDFPKDPPATRARARGLRGKPGGGIRTASSRSMRASAANRQARTRC